MVIFLHKFGHVLTSRQSGKEAYAAFLPTLNGIKNDEEVVVDFDGVNTFSPSWGDEFLTPLQARFGDRLRTKNIENPSVALTLKSLARINGREFKVLE